MSAVFSDPCCSQSQSELSRYELRGADCPQYVFILLTFHSCALGDPFGARTDSPNQLRLKIHARSTIVLGPTQSYFEREYKR